MSSDEPIVKRLHPPILFRIYSSTLYVVYVLLSVIGYLKNSGFHTGLEGLEGTGAIQVVTILNMW